MYDMTFTNVPRKLLLGVCLILFTSWFYVVPRPIQAQTTAFLGTPYYENTITISQWFNGSSHYGIDFLARYDRILAAADGTIEHLRWYNADRRCLNTPDSLLGCGYGLYIQINHHNGYITRYGHLSVAVGVEGEVVKQGQVIATSGNTGCPPVRICTLKCATITLQ